MTDAAPSSVNSAPRKRHRHISAATWSTVAAFTSRERSLLAEVAGAGSRYDRKEKSDEFISCT